jgi:hypothetical protein
VAVDVTMTKNLHLVGALLAGGFAGALATGCLGPEVLNERTEHFPAPNPQVELRLKRTPPADVLVLYDEQEPESRKVTRRAFYLFANQKQLANGKRPDFVPVSDPESLVPIPIFNAPPADPKAIPGELYAVSPSPDRIDLRSRDRTLAEFELPAYGDWLTAKKFFLFPLAAAADAVGVGAAAGAAGAMGALEEAAREGKSFQVP